MGADSIILGIGQRTDLPFIQEGAVSLHKDGTIMVDPKSGRTGHERIYAGGDAVRGPATVIEACADGKRAADAICLQLGVSTDLPLDDLPVLSEEDIAQVKRVRARRTLQRAPPVLPPEERTGFDLIETTLDEAGAVEEASRCVQCSSFCDKCVEVCPNRANYTFFVSPLDVRVPKITCREGELEISGEETFGVVQNRQILHVQDFCNECGNCTTFCVHEGKPHADKPRLFLEKGDFEREEGGNAFHIERDERGWVIRRRENGEESRLSVEGEAKELIFENERLWMRLSSDFQIKSMRLKKSFEGEFSLTGPAEMWVILRGVTSSLPFLPLTQNQKSGGN
jgi:putative selenate reductase